MKAWKKKFPEKSHWKARGGWRAYIYKHTADGMVVKHMTPDRWRTIKHMRTGMVAPNIDSDCDLMEPWSEEAE